MLELIGPSSMLVDEYRFTFGQRGTKTTVRLSIVLTNKILTVELHLLEIIQQSRNGFLSKINKSGKLPLEITSGGIVCFVLEEI